MHRGQLRVARASLCADESKRTPPRPACAYGHDGGGSARPVERKCRFERVTPHHRTTSNVRPGQSGSRHSQFVSWRKLLTAADEEPGAELVGGAFWRTYGRVFRPCQPRKLPARKPKTTSRARGAEQGLDYPEQYDEFLQAESTKFVGKGGPTGGRVGSPIGQTAPSPLAQYGEHLNPGARPRRCTRRIYLRPLAIHLRGSASERWVGQSAPCVGTPQ